MYLENIRSKLIGTEEERAVSPVIGGILMVTITVILAAVIAAFVLDLGGSVGQEAQAAANMEFDESDEELSIEITSLGNADYVTFGGEASEFEQVSDEFPDDPDGNDVDPLSETAFGVGDAVTVDNDHITSDVEGTVTAIAVIEEDDTQTQVASVDIDITN